MKSAVISVSIWVPLVFSVALLETLSEAFEIKTHEQLTEVAAMKSNLDGYLKNVFTPCYFSVPYSSETYCLGFPEGIDQPLFNGKKPLGFLIEGSANEDKPDIRSRHHFHNPRLPWNQAGLGWCVWVCESSIVWSQDQNQNIGGKHSWKDARDSYFQALTATTQADRDKYFAETFRTLGHLIHHVQDAATPAHTRDDTHIIRDDLHKWVEANGATMITSIGESAPGSLPLPAFDTSLLSQGSANPFAPVAIARIIDATDGDRGVLASGYNIGLAEYSNANFFSDDTIFGSNFLFPSPSQLEPSIDEDAATNEKKPYLRFKTGSGGENDYRVARISALTAITNATVATADMLLDDAVMNDYARKLVPRAISYSRGMIDYFFRTGLGFGGWLGTPPYTIDPSTIVFGHFPAEWFGSYENSVLTDHAGTGRIVVTVHYSHNGQSHYFTLFDAVRSFQLDTTFYPGSDYVAEELINLNPMWQQIPEGASDLYGIVAYRGPLGQEQDAVIGGIGWFLAPPM